MDNPEITTPPKPVVTSAMTRMSNVFAAPSELYTEVASAPVQTTSWLTPLLVLMLIVLVSTYAVYNNPDLRQQIYSMQEAGMKKAVAEGKMTQEQSEMASERLENSGPVMFIAFGSLVQIFFLCVIFFLGTLIMWLIVKFGMKSGAPYSKLLEINGLSMWIGVFGAIVTIILISLMNSMHASPGGALLLGNSFDPFNKGHKLLAQINVFNLWQAGVCGIGVAKVAAKSTGTGMLVAFGVWALWALLATVAT